MRQRSCQSKIFGESIRYIAHSYHLCYTLCWQKIPPTTFCPKSHAYDAVAIACAIGEVVKPLTLVYQLRCVPRGNYQMYNGKHSEHKVWAPRKVKGWKLYELVEAKGQMGYIGGRRLKGSFVLKEVSTGKTIPEVVPSQLHRLARCLHGWIPAT